jgi:acetyl-CoA carboxylase biotin carboxyl carrier protein
MDKELLLSLLDKFNAGSAVELEITEGNFRFTLRKKEARDAPLSDFAITELLDSAGGNGGTEKPDKKTAQSAHLGVPAQQSGIEASGKETINSPIVATFYASPSPDTPSFVKIGSKVKAGETLCILEAMKMMNKLEAEFDCEILAVKAESGDMVEYAQPLFEVKRL